MRRTGKEKGPPRAEWTDLWTMIPNQGENRNRQRPLNAGARPSAGETRDPPGELLRVSLRVVEAGMGHVVILIAHP
jgi:hypothetical protein